MIPKIIHYCWFGVNPINSLAKNCIESWKKYCPDFEIRKWDESSFDICSNKFVEDAYRAKKYAFVSDYVRLYATYKYGGIYMDTDVEVVKPLDTFLKHQAFSGFEDEMTLPTGIMGCEQGFPLFRTFLCDYDKLKFVDDSEYCISITNVVLITKILKEHGIKLNNQFQIIDGMALYPKDYFCPKDYQTGLINMTCNTYTIHHFSGSWLPQKFLWEKQIKDRIKAIVGLNGIELIRKIKNIKKHRR